MSRSNDPAKSEHWIWIHQGISGNILWQWLVYNSDDVGRYSHKLGALVRTDRTALPPRSTSVVVPSGGVTEEALILIISSIPGSGGRPPELTTNDDHHGFSQLLDLAIGCWEYDCSINEEFRNFAKEVLGKWQTHYPEEFNQRTSGIFRQQPIDWMFIALVFEWQEILQTKSTHVVLEFEPKEKMDLGTYRNLPGDFQEIVTEMRRDIVLKTYNQIRDSWISLYDPENQNGGSMGIIHSFFNEPPLNLDLRKPAPERLHEQTDADGLLRKFETILSSVGKQDEPQPQPRERRGNEAVKQDAKSSRGGGGFSVAARSTFKSTLEVSKKVFRASLERASLDGAAGRMSSGQPNEYIELWRETNNWRTNSLSKVPFENSRFSELRNRHIQQPASELDTNERNNGIHGSSETLP